mgnify:FL=1
MKRLFLSILFVSLTMLIWSQVTVDQKIDTMQILIGEQTKLTLSVTLDEKHHKVSFPKFERSQYITPGVEVLESGNIDTLGVEDNLIKYSKSYTLTSFDEKLYCIPSQSIKVDGKSYQTKDLALKVMTVPVDTVHSEKFYGPKDVQDNPFSWSEWATIFGYSILFVLLLILIAYLINRLNTNKSVIKPIKFIKKVSAHQKAITEIEKLKEEKAAVSEDQKSYYTRLTMILRQYIAERFNFDAMEMTSSEIIERLRGKNEGAIDEMVSLFRTADLVKFAKYSVLTNENDQNLVNALSFINDTKKEEEKPVKIVVEENEVEKKVKSQRRTLKLAIVVLTAAALFALIVVIYKVYLIV